MAGGRSSATLVRGALMLDLPRGLPGLFSSLNEGNKGIQPEHLYISTRQVVTVNSKAQHATPENKCSTRLRLSEPGEALAEGHSLAPHDRTKN